MTDSHRIIDEMSSQSFATVLQSWLDGQRMSREALIRLSGLSRQTVYGMLAGTAIPTTPTIRQVAQGLASRSLTDLDVDPELERTIFHSLAEALAFNGDIAIEQIPEWRAFRMARGETDLPGLPAENMLADLLKEYPNVRVALAAIPGPISPEDLQELANAVGFAIELTIRRQQQGREGS